MLPLTLLLAQTLSARTVSFDAPAMPLARLLPALGEKAGVEIVASATVARDVALLRVREKPLEEILLRIAGEDGAEVERTEKGFRIVRTAASERKERATALAVRVASLRPALDATRTSLALPADAAAYRNLLPSLVSGDTKDGGRWLRAGTVSARTRSPIARAAMRAALALPAEELADLRESDRLVLSNRPTRLQRPFPPLDAILRSYETERTAWTKVTAGRLPKSENEEEAEGAAVRAVVVVRRTNSSEAAFVGITILNAQGEDLGSASYGLQAEEMRVGMAALDNPSDDTPVPTTADTAALLSGVPSIDGSGPATASPEAVALLSRPELRDPLAFAATDLVRDMAQGRSVVAVLPDPAWLAGFVRPGGLKRTARTFLETLVQTRDEGGWLLLRPRDPVAARQDRVDRAVLGRFVRTIVAKGRVPLDDYAEYAWSASEAPSDVMGVFVAMMLSRGTFDPDVDWSVLRLYGSFDAFARKTMLNGGAKVWATLSPRQRGLAKRIVTKSIRSISGPSERFRSRTLLFEPTEVYKDGYDGLSVKLGLKEDAPLFCDSTINPRARGWKRVLDARSVGSLIGMKDGPDFDRFGVARRKSVTLSISAKQGVGTGATLEDVVPPKGPLVSLADLPETVRAAVEAGRAEAETARRTDP